MRAHWRTPGPATGTPCAPPLALADAERGRVFGTADVAQPASTYPMDVGQGSRGPGLRTGAARVSAPPQGAGKGCTVCRWCTSRAARAQRGGRGRG